MSNKLGIAIRNYREKYQLSQSEMAKRIDISASYVSMIENDKVDRLPRKALLPAIDFVLGMDKPQVMAFNQSEHATRLMHAIQNNQVPGALLSRMINILERGYD